MTKQRAGRHSHHRRRLSIEPAAALTSGEDVDKPVVRLISYNKTEFIDKPVDNLTDVPGFLDKNKVVWIDIDGIRCHKTLKFLGESFAIHNLCLEDVINTQRPKLEQYDDRFFLVLQQLTRPSTGDLTSFQIAMAFGKGYLVTFHDGPWKLADQIAERIKSGSGAFRESGVDYLVYGIFDGVIDEYFPLLENFGEDLDKLETEIIDDPQRSTIGSVHTVKRELLSVRRAMWPTREALNALLRDGPPLVTENTILHLRDVYDHTVQIIDFIETYRELGADLMDVYLSSISNRMNEVMKVLTIITTIFVPPTLIAGIYGMNFHHEISPYNMPELSWYYGYPICLGVMALISLSILFVLWRRGWLDALTSIKHDSSPRK